LELKQLFAKNDLLQNERALLVRMNTLGVGIVVSDVFVHGFDQLRNASVVLLN